MQVPLASRRLIAGLLVSASVFWGDGGLAKKGRPKPAQSAYEDVLDAQKPAVVECVMEHGLKKGVPSVELQIAMRLTGVGQIMSCDVGVKQEGGDKKAMADCVKKAVTAGRYPQTPSPLIELSRTWTFAFK